VVRTQQRRETVAHMKTKGLSYRRSCVLCSISRRAARYAPRRGDDRELLERIRAVQECHRDYGYRRTHGELTQGEKGVLNHKRVHRVWCQYGLQHPLKKKRKRNRGGCVPLTACYANHVWTYDFVHDSTMDGRNLKFLTLLDEHNRRSLAVQPRRSFTAQDVIEQLEQAVATYGAPAYIRSDNGSEFIARIVKAWLKKMGIQTHYIDPGSPWQNPFGESFNSIVRREFLNKNLFATLGEAELLSHLWRKYYNEQRIHTRLNYTTPQRYFMKTACCCEQNQDGPSARDLSPKADPEDKEAETQLSAASQPSVFGPAPALGSLPSVALSSGRVTQTIPTDCETEQTESEILSSRMAPQTGA